MIVEPVATISGVAETADVVVVGAGPAGSAAAITLARASLRVILIDKARFPREKCCGDGLTTAALRRLEGLGLEPWQVESWQAVESVAIVGSRGSTFELPLPSDGTLFAASARRYDLDSALVAIARATGVRVIEGCAVNLVSPGPRANVEIRADGGLRFQANYVVAADGMWSPTRKALGVHEQGYLGEWQAGRQYVGRVGPEARKLWIWFDPDMVPGYAWSFPLPDGRANVGYGIIRGSRNPDEETPLKGQQIDLLERPHIAEVLGPAATPETPWRAWPIPTGISNARLSALNGRVLFTGDAARAADPMTGEGIAQALETGELAARAIAGAGPDHPAAAARRYHRDVRCGISIDHKLSQALSRVLARPGGSERSLALVDRRDLFRKSFARWMFEDYPRAVLVTPQRWKRRLLSGPGAYPKRTSRWPL